MRLDIPAVYNCHSIEQIVNLINIETACDAETEDMVAVYAIESAREDGYGTGKEELECHIDYLEEYGAIFNKDIALKTAIKYAQ